MLSLLFSLFHLHIGLHFIRSDLQIHSKQHWRFLSVFHPIGHSILQRDKLLVITLLGYSIISSPRSHPGNLPLFLAYLPRALRFSTGKSYHCQNAAFSPTLLPKSLFEQTARLFFYKSTEHFSSQFNIFEINLNIPLTDCWK